jgi:hypothetical protein
MGTALDKRVQGVGTAVACASAVAGDTVAMAVYSIFMPIILTVS